MTEEPGKITILQNIIALQRKQIDALRQTALIQDAQIVIKDALLEAYREEKYGAQTNAASTN